MNPNAIKHERRLARLERRMDIMEMWAAESMEAGDTVEALTLYTTIASLNRQHERICNGEVA